MIILGLDPGLATVGIGVISIEGSKLKHLYHGVIRTPAKTQMSLRLLHIFDELTAVIDTYKPTLSSIETLFFHSNKTTAMAVSQARGVLILGLSRYHIPITDYTPIQIKSAVCGYGKAEKRQVQVMVQKLLSLPKRPTPDDAADGLAIAICHAHSYRLHSRL